MNECYCQTKSQTIYHALSSFHFPSHEAFSLCMKLMNSRSDSINSSRQTEG